MKKIILFLLLVLVSIISNGQQYSDKVPIQIIDIEKGINNFDYLRAVLLENGLKLEKKDFISEYWSYQNQTDYNSTNSFTPGIFRIQASVWKFPKENKKFTVIFFFINTEYLRNYCDIFYENIKKRFPSKKVVSIETTERSETREGYGLTYFRNGSPIEVDINLSEPIHEFTFTKTSSLH